MLKWLETKEVKKAFHVPPEDVFFLTDNGRSYPTRRAVGRWVHR
jgi:hypothetical protein